MTSLVKAKVSTVVSKQAPEFVREEHTQFIKFLEAYYEWMEQDGNAGSVMRNIESAKDIDKTVDDFVQYFTKELMVAIPEYVLSDKRLLAQRIHDLYRAKGTQQSYELLFRILYNEPAEIYFPKEDLLRASDGKYDQRTVIKVIETSGDAFFLVGQTITQVVDSTIGAALASARVESVIKSSAGASIIAEINVNSTTITGTFVPGSTITGLNNVDDTVIQMATQTMITNVRLDSQGSYYSIGQKFTTAAGSGQDFLCEVATVKRGSISGVFIETPGANYQRGQAVTFDNTDTGGTGAIAVVEEVDQTAILLETTTGALFSTNALTFDIGDASEDYVPLPSYTNLAGTRLTGSGTGAAFNIGFTEATPDVYTVDIYSSGDNYTVGDTIKILGTSVGGATTANDITITVATLSDIVISAGDFTVGKNWQIVSSNVINGTVAVSGTAGEFTVTTGSLNVNANTFVTVTGTNGGTSTITDYASNTVYKIASITTSANTNSFISGGVYTVSVVGTTTLAQWQTRFSTLTSIPVIGQVITATSTGTISGTGRCKYTNGFTLQNADGTAIVTSIGTVTGLTFSLFGSTTPEQWNDIAGTTGQPYKVGTRFVAALVGTGKGSGRAIQTSIDTVTFTGTAPSVAVTADSNRQTGRISDTSILSSTDSYMLLENGSKIIPEDATIGGIKSIKLVNGGTLYNKVPIPTAVTTTGSGAKLIAFGEDIGKITSINITNLGVYYESKPTVASPVNAVIKNLNATSFLPGEPIYSEPEVLLLESGGELLLESSFTDRILVEEQNNGYGVFESFNSARNLLTISPANIKNRIVSENGLNYITFEDERKIVTEDSGEFTKNQVIHGLTSGARARVISIGHAEVTPERGAVGKYIGVFIGADGKVSESSKHMPDNLYYQEFSYVIRAGLSIDKYRDAVKRILHPVGLAMFGQVNTQSIGDASMPGTDSRTYDPSNIRLALRAIIDAKMKSQHRDTVLVFPLFVEANMRMHILASDFLPTLYFPRSEPLNVYVLDLRSKETTRWHTHLWLDPMDLRSTFIRGVVRIESKVLKANTQLVGGPRLGHLEKLKFFIPPYEAGTKNSLNLNRDAWPQSYPAPNDTYWDNYGTTQIKDFKNIVLSDVINSPNKKVNFCLIDAHIDIINTAPGLVTFDNTENYLSMDNNTFFMDYDTERVDADDIYMDDNQTTMDSIK